MAGILWFTILAACGRPVPSGPEDCEGLSPGANADACWTAVIPALARTDPERASQYAEERVADDQTRDFLYLQLTRDVDPGNARWCHRIREKMIQDRCTVLVRRPHLHRALGVATEQARKDGAATPGPPPPGAPPPGAPPPVGALPGGAPPATPSPSNPQPR